MERKDVEREPIDKGTCDMKNQHNKKGDQQKIKRRLPCIRGNEPIVICRAIETKRTEDQRLNSHEDTEDPVIPRRGFEKAFTRVDAEEIVAHPHKGVIIDAVENGEDDEKHEQHTKEHVISSLAVPNAYSYISFESVHPFFLCRKVTIFL
jgi:hypothetical protein